MNASAALLLPKLACALFEGCDPEQVTRAVAAAGIARAALVH